MIPFSQSGSFMASGLVRLIVQLDHGQIHSETQGGGLHLFANVGALLLELKAELKDGTLVLVRLRYSDFEQHADPLRELIHQAIREKAES